MSLVRYQLIIPTRAATFMPQQLPNKRHEVATVRERDGERWRGRRCKRYRHTLDKVRNSYMNVGIRLVMSSLRYSPSQAIYIFEMPIPHGIYVAVGLGFGGFQHM